MQFPCPGAPENLVHCDIANAAPRRPFAVRFLSVMSDATEVHLLVNCLKLLPRFELRVTWQTCHHLHPSPPPPPFGG